jgi:hypothetical protein
MFFGPFCAASHCGEYFESSQTNPNLERWRTIRPIPARAFIHMERHEDQLILASAFSFFERTGKLVEEKKSQEISLFENKKKQIKKSI